MVSLLGFMLIGYYLIAFYLLFYGSFHLYIFNSRRTNGYLTLITIEVDLFKGDLIAFFTLYPVDYYVLFFLYPILLPTSCNYRVNLGLLV